MTARGYKFFAWLFIGVAFYALINNLGATMIICAVCVSFVSHAASDILKAIGK